MFLLDTNVLSELMRARTAPGVAKWVSDQPSELLFTAAGVRRGFSPGLPSCRKDVGGQKNIVCCPTIRVRIGWTNPLRGSRDFGHGFDFAG
jgi:hypothetical protein